METTTVDIEPWNDQTIAHNQDSQSGGDTIDHSMEVIILEIDMCQFLVGLRFIICLFNY